MCRIYNLFHTEHGSTRYLDTSQCYTKTFNNYRDKLIHCEGANLLCPYSGLLQLEEFIQDTLNGS